MTRVDSPLPDVEFDGIWHDGVERYREETVAKLPDVVEDCTTSNSTLDLINKRHRDFPLKFAIPREDNRIFRDLLMKLLELLRKYATCVCPEEGEVRVSLFRVFLL